MSEKYDNSMRGVLFQNEYKGENEKAPDYKGSCEVGGIEYWIAGWKQESQRDGSVFLSLRFESKEDAEKRNGSGKKPAPRGASKKTAPRGKGEDDGEGEDPSPRGKGKGKKAF